MGKLLDLANMELPEPKAVPAGEYPLQIVKVTPRTIEDGTAYKSGREGYDIFLKVTNEPEAKLVSHRIFLNKKEDPETTVEFFARQVQELIAAFKIDSEDVQDWVGLEAYAILEVEEGTEEYPEDRNNVKKFIKTRK